MERYLSGKLPVKGAAEFERFCRDNPDVLDAIGLPERVNAGLRLLESGGKPEPWREEPKRFWQKPQLTLGLAAATLFFALGLAIVAGSNSDKALRITKLQKQLADQPLDPAATTRTIRLLPNRKGASNTPAIMIGGESTYLADLRIDVSSSPFRMYRVTIDRIDQGRVSIIHNLMKDSNGHLRIALNSSALGPGNYQFTLEGLTWKGEAQPDSWITVGIKR